MHALIEKGTNKILRIAAEGHDLAPEKPFYWLSCPDNVAQNWTFDGTTFLPPQPLPLSDVKLQKRGAINAKRDELETSGFTYNGKTFDSDQRSTDRIQIAALAAQTALMTSQPFSIDWTAKDNSVVTLDAQGMLGLATAFAQYGATLHATAKALKAQVDAATTVEKVEAVQWP